MWNYISQRAVHPWQEAPLLSLCLCHVTELQVFSDQLQCLHLVPRDRNLSCLSCCMHNMDVMTCRWGRGHAASEGAQYWMFWRDASLGRDQDRECETSTTHRAHRWAARWMASCLAGSLDPDGDGRGPGLLHQSLPAVRL